MLAAYTLLYAKMRDETNRHGQLVLTGKRRYYLIDLLIDLFID